MIRTAAMTQAVAFTIAATALLCNTAAAAPLVTFESPYVATITVKADGP
jgi:hypothetical protein